MQIYLPIAEVSVSSLLLLLIGAMVGLLSGMFGVGGGFILTPLLFFIGIPPAVAVASAANQIAGSSFSAFLGHVRRKTVDFKMGLVMLAGGSLVIEMVFRLTVKASEPSSMTFFHVPLDAAAVLPWIVALLLIAVGFWLFRLSWPVVGRAWTEAAAAARQRSRAA